MPVENLVGEENKGWTYAKYLLLHERTNTAGVGLAIEGLDHLRMIAGKEEKDGAPLLDDPFFAARLSEIEIDLAALRARPTCASRRPRPTEPHPARKRPC